MPLTRDASGRLGVSADVSPLMSQAKGASATAASSGGRPDFNLKLTIEVNGARGNQEIEQMVREGVENGVQAGIEQYNRGLPDLVAEINSDPRVRW